MMWTEFSKKVVSGALAPVLVASLTPAMALAAEDSDALEATASAALVQEAAETAFTFADDGVTASDGASGYKVEGTELTINAAGTYVITGSCADGGITVKKGTTGVTLILRDLALGSSSGAPLACNKTSEVTVQVEGAVTLSDNENAADEDAADEAVADAFDGAAIKAKAGCALTIAGTGTLNVNGSTCKNGIKGGATSAVTIQDGVTINVDAANTGIAADGELTIAGGTVNVTAGNDGIKADPDDDDAESAGITSITGGIVTVNSSDDGIKGETTTITGGTITVNAADDGVKAEDVLTLGTQGATGGPTVNVESSTEGLEGATVNLYSGTGSITASDDGINAANGDLASESTSLFNLNIAGGDWTVNAGGDGLDSNGNITMTGGKMIVFGPTQGGNGVFDVADRGGTFTVSGGTLLGMGTSDMAVSPTSGVNVVFGASGMGGQPGGQPAGMGSGSGQPGGRGGLRPMGADEASEDSVDAQAFGGGAAGSSTYSISAGQTVAVKDTSGSELISATAPKSAVWAMFASDELQSGQTYSLYADGTQLMTATAQDGSAGGVANGQPGSANGQQPGGASGQPGDAGSQQPGQMPGGDMGGQPGQPGGDMNGQPGQSGQVPGGMNQQPGQESNGAQAASGTMYRLYNPNSGEHFYTSNVSEKDNLVQAGWRYEGVAWNAPSSGDAVYRLYNPYVGDHHYATSASERDSLVGAGWRYEGIGWYSASSSGTAMYRLYNPNAVTGSHHYTASASERDFLASLGWRAEGIGWYGA